MSTSGTPQAAVDDEPLEKLLVLFFPVEPIPDLLSVMIRALLEPIVLTNAAPPCILSLTGPRVTRLCDTSAGSSVDAAAVVLLLEVAVVEAAIGSLTACSGVSSQ
jgi:hypothetical protein